MKRNLLLFTTALFILSLSAQAQSRKIVTYAGSGGIGGFSGDGFTSTAAELNGPLDVSADRFGNVYIVDYYNFRIRKVRSNTSIVTFAGTGNLSPRTDTTIASSANINPIGVVADRRGNVYISDAGNSVVYKVNKAGILTTFAGDRTNGFSGDGGKARLAQLNFPYGLAIDSSENLYIADAGNHVVRRVDTFGYITTVAGTNSRGYYGDGGMATDAKLDTPHAIAIDMRGNMYIADRGNNLVRKVDASGMISTFAGLGYFGYTGDGGMAIAARFRYPAGVAVDKFGCVYISDSYNNAVRMVDSTGHIYTLAGNGTAGFGGDLGAPEGSNLFNPSGLSCDTLGTLYIADANNQRVRKIYRTTVGVQQVTLGGSIQYFPNPCSTNIQVTGLGDGERIAVMDAMGRLVTDSYTNGNGKTVCIDLQHLSPGNYFLRVVNRTNSVVNIKSFVKQ